MPRHLKHTMIAVMAIGLVIAVLWRAGMTQGWLGSLDKTAPRPIQLRIWDWWSPSSNEEYGDYFAALEETFEQRNPDVNLVYQTVPFANYVQKLSTAMVGQTPPDFTLTSLAGANVTLSSFQGQKNVVLVFYRGHW